MRMEERMNDSKRMECNHHFLSPSISTSFRQHVIGEYTFLTQTV